ncbi:MAG: acylneuraminate cytidylyltransferase family protein [Candidatus Latescibacteria bacterium]|nr:acylneuraminate cytidylyltransferase family protein [Candidatus Latescibacterota bacterium]
MTEKKKIILGLVPARGGSKGVPGKNIRLVNGKPLIVHAIECGKSCPSINRIIISTDNEEFAAIAKKAGAEVPFMRPSHLALDTTPMLSVLEHALSTMEKICDCCVEAIVLLDPTAPLRKREDVEGAIALFKQGGADTIVSGNEAHRNPFFNMVSVDSDGFVHLVIDPGSPIGRRQDAPKVYDLNTVVWIFSRKSIMEEKARIAKRTKIYIVPPERAIDLDTEMDFIFLETMLKLKERS